MSDIDIQVYINPALAGEDRIEGGIRRVVEAQTKLLPTQGVGIATHPDSADIILNHGAMHLQRIDRPMVSQIHGLYWFDYRWPEWGHETNRRVIQVMQCAQAVTCPSIWVREATCRGMLVDPEVIYHGVNPNEWQPPESGKDRGYVLWNKARKDPVSDPEAIAKLAELLPDIPFLTTYGYEQLSNIHVYGALNYDSPLHRQLLQEAGVYLATVRETMGIGTLEAMACGVPIVGWDFGGQREIVKHGETGFLAPYGDYKALANYITLALQGRKRLGANARTDILERWTWRWPIEQYANLLRRTVIDWNRPKPKVSVVITTYNLARYLGDAVKSVLNQSMGDWECVIVDDCSTDGPEDVLRAIEPEIRRRIRLLRTPQNLGLSGARNFGWRRSTGKYVIFLDADDMLDQAALERLSDALDRDPYLHIAFGGLDLIDEQGNGRAKNEWPRESFDWLGQISHLNQLSYSSMMRREVLERSGGYRTRDWRAEDASFWTLVTSMGFRAARVTQESTLIYRLRSGSKGGKEREQYPDIDGDWTRWYPWRTGATSGVEGEHVRLQNKQPNAHQVPFGAQGTPPAPLKAWPVWHYQDPIVSVVIPVGPGHQQFLLDALDSVRAQTVTNWEVIVVWDAAQKEHPTYFMPSHPYARVYSTYEEGKAASATEMGAGAGAARNIGIAKARAPFIVFLDADDILYPQALERLLEMWLAKGGYTYSDCFIPNDDARPDQEGSYGISHEYDQTEFVRGGYVEGGKGGHGVTALVARADLLDIGGFDEQIPFWEDWKLYQDLAIAGIEGHRVPEALYVYRMGTGNRRESGRQIVPQLREYLKAIYDPYMTGEKEMCSCSGGKLFPAAQNRVQDELNKLRAPVFASPAGSAPNVPGPVRLHYIGPFTAAVTFKGKKTKTIYRFGRETQSEFGDVAPEDVDDLLLTGDFRIVDQAAFVQDAV